MSIRTIITAKSGRSAYRYGGSLIAKGAVVLAVAMLFDGEHGMRHSLGQDRSKPNATAQGDKGANPDSAGNTSQEKSGATTDDPWATLTVFIDREISNALSETDVQLSPASDDGEFLRRLHLDLVGRIPDYEATRAFLSSDDPAKRTKMIDALLANEEFGRRFADIWCRWLIHSKNPGRQRFENWLAAEFNRNRPWNELCYSLISASGESIEENPAVVFFQTELETRPAQEITNLVSARILGIQLECAECHDHPYDEWSQNDYWGLANFFTKVGRTKTAGLKNGREQGVQEVKQAKGKMSEHAIIREPQFLRGPTVSFAAGAPRRPAVAAWATSRENTYFSWAIVNRMWAHFLGRGIVNPVDDLSKASSVPTHPDLIKQLAETFVANQYDLKALIRAICLSDTYQRSSRVMSSNEVDVQFYSHALVRPLSPEQLYNSFRQLGLLGVNEEESHDPKAIKKSMTREKFRAMFGLGPEESDPLEYDRGIAQALYVMNSRNFLDRQRIAVDHLLDSSMDQRIAIETLYLTTLSRYPTVQESHEIIQFLGAPAAGRNKNDYGDVLWILLNSSEFNLNR